MAADVSEYGNTIPFKEAKLMPAHLARNRASPCNTTSENKSQASRKSPVECLVNVNEARIIVS